MQWKTCETGSKIKGNYRLGPREPVRVLGCIHQGNTFLGAPFPSWCEEGHAHPLQCSSLPGKKPMDRGAGRATVHGVGHGWVTERFPSWWLPPSLSGNTYQWGIVPWSELMARLLIQLSAPVWGNLESFRKTDGSISDANAIFKSSCVCDKKNKPEFRAVPGPWAQSPVGPKSPSFSQAD